MKTGVGIQHTCINAALFRALPTGTRAASHLLWSPATLLQLFPVIFFKGLCLHLSMYIISPDQLLFSLSYCTPP